MSKRKNTGKNRQRANYFDFGASSLVYFLVVVLFIAFPLYTNNGYEAIASNKYRFFMLTAIYAGITFLAYIVVAFVIWGFSRNSFKKTRESNILLGAVGLYTFTNLISFLFSSYKTVEDGVVNDLIPWFTPGALWGCRSWYMGLVTSLLMTLITFIIGYFLIYKEYIFYPVLLGLLLVSGWGILNRYTIYPIKMEYASETFISSLGNVDWYCGYLILLSPLAYGLYMVAKSRWKAIALWLISYIMIIATVISGAESGHFAFGITMVAMLAISFKSPKYLRKFTSFLFNLITALITIRIVDRLYPYARTQKHGLSELMIKTPVIVLLLLLTAILALYLILEAKEKVRYSNFLSKYAGKTLVIVTALIIVLAASLVVINTKSEKKLPVIGDISYFNYDMQWGSDRGACYYISVETYKQMTPLKKIFGAGTDAFYFEAYEKSKIQEVSSTYLWKLKLTNAHNEVLNTLVNEGILGLISLVLMWLVIFKTLFKNIEKEPVTIAFILAFTSYLANNVFSFRSIESTPLLYGLFGIVIALLSRASKVDKSGLKD